MDVWSTVMICLLVKAVSAVLAEAVGPASQGTVDEKTGRWLRARGCGE